MARDVVDSEIVESRDALAAWLEAGCKPNGPLRVGAEHEKIAFHRADRSPVPYAGETGIRALIEGMNAGLGWERIEDGGNVIGLYDANGGAAISLEPGGQFELSGAPLDDAHATAEELERHLEVCRSVAEPLGIGFLTLGMSPKWTLAETPSMPKQRYEIMTRYMPRVGTRGLDMMYRTATVQANLDFRDEKDMVAKLRVGLALQPAITALFANSPFTDGRLNGFLSGRSEIWRHTDPARSGMLAFAFEPGMGFERYVDYALDVPLYFVKRGSTYIDVAGASFRDLLAGRLAGAPGERATMADWANHLSTIFPEVRLKRYLEMRGADVGPPERIVALRRAHGRPLLRRGGAAVGAGPGRGLERRGPPESARPGAAARTRRQDPRPRPAVGGDRDAGDRRRRTEAAKAAQRQRARTRRFIFVHWKRSPGADARRRRTGSPATRARGGAASIPSLPRRRSGDDDRRPAPPDGRGVADLGSIRRRQRAKSSWLTCMKTPPGPPGAPTIVCRGPNRSAWPRRSSVGRKTVARRDIAADANTTVRIPQRRKTLVKDVATGLAHQSGRAARSRQSVRVRRAGQPHRENSRQRRERGC